MTNNENVEDGSPKTSGEFMLKPVLRYLGYTLAVAFAGLTVLILGLSLVPESRHPSGASLLLLIVGVTLLYGSPIMVAAWFWRGKHKHRKASERLKAEAAAVEAAVQVQEEAEQAARIRYFERERLIDAVDQHKTALSRNLRMAVRKNDYGAVVENRQREALFEFLASIGLDMQAIGLDEAIQVVLEQLDYHEELDRRSGFNPDCLPFDGHAFEHWVAAALSGFGWQAEVTIGSGDQGIDVIASKDGRKLGLQCKLYSAAIGNKAVQEAHAGKSYYGVDRVGVLSNANYTVSAKSLAAATGVLLLSHHDIPSLYEKAFPDYR